MDQEEVHERLASLRHGPWASKGKFALKTMYAPNLEEIVGRGEIDLSQIEPSGFNENETFIQRSLRYSGNVPVTDPKAQKLRGSLDSTFTHLQLMELAIQTGYLPSDVVRESARANLAAVLWSQPAQSFVQAYQYLPVAQLANRVDMTGLSDARPPEIQDDNALRFASFLASLRQLESSPFVSYWKQVADGQVGFQSGEAYLRYLSGESEESPRGTLKVLAGLREYVVTLADLVRSLPRGSEPPFVSFYRYWLDRLYVDITSTPGQFSRSWADALDVWVQNNLSSEKRSDPWVREERELLADSSSTLRRVWQQYALRSEPDWGLFVPSDRISLKPTLTRYGGLLQHDENLLSKG
ncbi:MAG: hypothetical protein RJQ07_01655 [Pseudomonadales bacterium]